MNMHALVAEWLLAVGVCVSMYVPMGLHVPVDGWMDGCVPYIGMASLACKLCSGMEARGYGGVSCLSPGSLHK